MGYSPRGRKKLDTAEARRMFKCWAGPMGGAFRGGAFRGRGQTGAQPSRSRGPSQPGLLAPSRSPKVHLLLQPAHRARFPAEDLRQRRVQMRGG